MRLITGFRSEPASFNQSLEGASSLADVEKEFPGICRGVPPPRDPWFPISLAGADVFAALE